ncbi:MAG: hypothetical protein KY455_01240, partial [Euryarchaeota archaeon]|nr:hypothetical protein [Euryarchaeota archaeon]
MIGAVTPRMIDSTRRKWYALGVFVLLAISAVTILPSSPETTWPLWLLLWSFCSFVVVAAGLVYFHQDVSVFLPAGGVGLIVGIYYKMYRWQIDYHESFFKLVEYNLILLAGLFVFSIVGIVVSRKRAPQDV